MKKFLIIISMLLAALCLLTSCGEEELRYNVTGVKFDVSHCMTSDEYYLTNSEINELLDGLSAIDFTQLEIVQRPVFPEGGSSFGIEIQTETESWELTLSPPYVILDHDSVYQPSLDSVFTTVRSIEEAHIES